MWFLLYSLGVSILFQYLIWHTNPMLSKIFFLNPNMQLVELVE